MLSNQRLPARTVRRHAATTIARHGHKIPVPTTDDKSRPYAIGTSHSSRVLHSNERLHPKKVMQITLICISIRKYCADPTHNEALPMKISALLSILLLSSGLCLSAAADTRPDHFTAKPSDTLTQAVGHFSEYNSRLQQLLQQ